MDNEISLTFFKIDKYQWYLHVFYFHCVLFESYLFFCIFPMSNFNSSFVDIIFFKTIVFVCVVQCVLYFEGLFLSQFSYDCNVMTTLQSIPKVLSCSVNASSSIHIIYKLILQVLFTSFFQNYIFASVFRN